MADELWTRAELKAALEAYLQVVAWEAIGRTFSPTALHRELIAGPLSARSPGSVGRRMSNITSVLKEAGEPIATRYRASLDHVGPGPKATLLSLLAELRGEAVEPSTDTPTVTARANTLLARGPVPRPAGAVIPPRRPVSPATQVVRDPAVVAWVLQEARGICEACGEPAPFTSLSGQPFLEVHHLHRLGDDGPDVVENAIATCPNCHRRLHYGMDRDRFARLVRKGVARLAGD